MVSKRLFLFLLSVLLFSGLQAQKEETLLDSGLFGLDTLNKKMDSLILSAPCDHRPIIGIGGMFHGRDTAVQSLYVQAVEDAGGSPLVLPVIQETAILLRYSNM